MLRQNWIGQKMQFTVLENYQKNQQLNQRFEFSGQNSKIDFNFRRENSKKSDEGMKSCNFSAKIHTFLIENCYK